jgi:hypothetical protein
LKVEVLGGFDSYNFDYSRDFAFVQIGAETPSNLHRSGSVSDCKGFCGAQGSNDQVFWQVGSSATLGTTTDFYGSVIADQSVTLKTGANVNCGRVIALNGAVTMDTNNIDTGNCIGGTGTTPEPGTIALVATGGAMAAGANSSNFSFWGLGGSIAAFFRKRKR